MAFSIVLAPEAADDLRRLKADVRATVRDALDIHLRHEPQPHQTAARDAPSAIPASGRGSACVL
jgi:mRNA-degrading endonuclease RelE of RelBE toxin-antitoxin system